MTIEFLDWTIDFHQLGISVFKIALALICAGVIGIERGRKKRIFAVRRAKGRKRTTNACKE